MAAVDTDRVDLPNESMEQESEWTEVKVQPRVKSSFPVPKVPKEILSKIVYPKHRTVAIIFGGLPGSGKSTARQALIDRIISVNKDQDRVGTIEYNVVSTDDYVQSFADRDGLTFGAAYEECRRDLSKVFENQKANAMTQARLSLRDPLTLQYIVIFDLTNVRIGYRAYINELKRHNFTVFGIFFSSIIKNTKVPHDVFVKMKEALEPPTVKEGFDRLYITKTLEGRSIDSITSNLKEFCPLLTRE